MAARVRRNADRARRARVGEPGERPFAVKGVFRYVWNYVKPRKIKKVWYETRILRVVARDERVAKANAHRVFKTESCVASWPAPGLSSTVVSYMGIGGLLDMESELEPEELWWELVDERPRVIERAR